MDGLLTPHCEMATMAETTPDAKWPYVAVAVGLFGLTLLAPRIWRPAEHKAAPQATPEPREIEPETAGPEALPPRVIEPAPAISKRVAPRPVAAPMAPEPAVTDAFPDESLVEVATVEPLEPAGVWPRAVALREELERLCVDEVTREWAEKVLDRLVILEDGDDLSPEQFEEAVGDLESAEQQAVELADRLAGHHVDLDSDVLRAQYALARRLDVWRAAYGLSRDRNDGSTEDFFVQADANETPGVREILEQIEEYEASRPASMGRALVAVRRELARSSEPEARRLGEHLESHYRNANLRFCVSGVLLNRLLPPQKAVESEVDDVVAGSAVRGWRWTDTKVRVRLLPDERRIRLGLEAYGDVVSHTYSTTGPATFFSAGQSQFLARKLVLFDGVSLRQYSSVANADTDTTLRELRTDFDVVPLLGSVVQSIARSQYDERREVARREVEERVARQARDELERQATPKLEWLAQGWRENVVRPLARFDLRPTVMSQSTDEQRIALRWRLAGDEQLGGHTARPRAPSDSLLSLQIHESAINNAIENFALEGRTFELRSLYDTLAERLGRPDLKAPDDVPEEVYVTFAAEECLRVRLDHGKARVALRIKELTADERRWQDLVIHAEYQPATTGLNAQLARVEAVQVAGDRLSTKSQVTLKAIFSRMFTRNRQVRLLPETITKDKRLSDLQVSQFVIEDCWLGLAIGLNRVAARPKAEQHPLR